MHPVRRRRRKPGGGGVDLHFIPCSSRIREAISALLRSHVEIRKSLTQSASAFNRGNVQTILGSYAPDAVVLPPNSPAVQGLVAIRQLWESLLAAGYRNAAFELDDIEHWGEVALASGRYKVQIPNKSGATEEDRGKYVGHWRRMPDRHFRA
jgi:ketosteroid isomerase-like protein